MAGGSAGSNQVGAIVKWSAQVICPRGARGWAAAVLRRSQSCCQAASPATLPSVPWSTRRRVRGSIRGWGWGRTTHLLGGKGEKFPEESQGGSPPSLLLQRNPGAHL